MVLWFGLFCWNGCFLKQCYSGVLQEGQDAKFCTAPQYVLMAAPPPHSWSHSWWREQGGDIASALLFPQAMAPTASGRGSLQGASTWPAKLSTPPSFQEKHCNARQGQRLSRQQEMQRSYERRIYLPHLLSEVDYCMYHWMPHHSSTVGVPFIQLHTGYREQYHMRVFA